MMLDCDDEVDVGGRNLSRLGKFVKREFVYSNNIETIQLSFVKRWIVSMNEYSELGKRYIVIDDVTRQVNCSLL